MKGEMDNQTLVRLLSLALDAQDRALAERDALLQRIASADRALGDALGELGRVTADRDRFLHQIDALSKACDKQDRARAEALEALALLDITPGVRGPLLEQARALMAPLGNYRAAQESAADAIRRASEELKTMAPAECSPNPARPPT